MEHTDIQLKHVLSKLLPGKLVFVAGLLQQNGSARALETELLNLCREAEAALTPQEAFDYVNALVVIAREIKKGATRSALLTHFVVVHASWQQKVTALAKIKQIKIK